jgi:hypothetical protein
MAAGDYQVGLDGTFFYGTAGTTATVEADNVDDVVLTCEPQMATAVRRGKKWETNKPIYLKGSLTFKVLDIEGNLFLAAIKAASLGLYRIALYPTVASGGDGLDADYYVSFNRNENNPDFVTYDVTAVPTDELRDPVWV